MMETVTEWIGTPDLEVEDLIYGFLFLAMDDQDESKGAGKILP
jgi:hypothetical protein